LTDSPQSRSKFPPLYWLVVVFEFFERGSYYGVMSVLSIYMVDVLGFAKQDVGLIKGTIQPLLYFLPIISGALADRFGYRRMLLIAFGLLGGGYFLVAQATGYAAVFLSLVVMGLGAGTFKPIISGTIARCTDKTNATLGFGIFYWSINLGAFLFPLILVPLLRDNVGWDWVILAAAIGTGTMLLPTFFLFREPPKAEPEAEPQDQKKKPSLLQTLANAFEIIYSPLVLLTEWARSSTTGRGLAAFIALALLAVGSLQFVSRPGTTHVWAGMAIQHEGVLFRLSAQPNLSKAKDFELKVDAEAKTVNLRLYRPDRLEINAAALRKELGEMAAFAKPPEMQAWVKLRDAAVKKTILDVQIDDNLVTTHAIDESGSNRLLLRIRSSAHYHAQREQVLGVLMSDPRLAALSGEILDDLVAKASQRSFLLLFVGLLFLVGLLVLGLGPTTARNRWTGALASLGVLLALIWLLPDLSIFARILTSVLSLTLLSMAAFERKAMERFADHARFLLMIVIYSGFWVLYFQMFDSVLWYVQAYVDPSSLNESVNAALAWLGLDFTWRFGVEMVTVVNAFTIILLQLVVSNLVKNTRALPTMIVGISLGTAGMAILAISSGIWIFFLGIIIFSIGEMTAHPKFISYVGQTAPKSRVAMYMGYLFLYGVIGSSIGGVVGANLYVKFVDELNQPRTLWLIFAGIGVATVIGLLLFDRFAKTDQADLDD